MDDVEQIRAERPRSVVTARTAAIVATVCWLVVTAVVSGSGSAGVRLTGSVGLVVVLLLAHLSGALGTAQGRQPARILMTLAAVALAAVLLPVSWLGWVDPALPGGPIVAVAGVAAVVHSAAACVLAFRPEVNRYVHLVGVARRSR